MHSRFEEDLLFSEMIGYLMPYDFLIVVDGLQFFIILQVYCFLLQLEFLKMAQLCVLLNDHSIWLKLNLLDDQLADLIIHVLILTVWIECMKNYLCFVKQLLDLNSVFYFFSIYFSCNCLVFLINFHSICLWINSEFYFQFKFLVKGRELYSVAALIKKIIKGVVLLILKYSFDAILACCLH